MSKHRSFKCHYSESIIAQSLEPNCSRRTFEWRTINHNSARVLLRVIASTFFWIAISGRVHANLNASTVTASTSLSTVRVAEPFIVEYTVTAPAGSRVDFPSISVSLGNFDVTEETTLADIPVSNDISLRTWTRSLTLESIVSGNFEIPSLEIRVRRGDETKILKTEPIPVQVASVLEDRTDPTNFRDIHSVVDIQIPEVPSQAWLWWTLCVTAGGIAACALVLTIRKRKAWLTPKAWAIRELDQIRTSPAMLSADCELVMQNLALVLKDYLELQFEFSAPVQTTCELMQVITSESLMGESVARGFQRLFENCDMVQFAGVHLSPEELKQAVDEAEKLISQTSDSLNLQPAKTASVEHR